MPEFVPLSSSLTTTVNLNEAVLGNISGTKHRFAVLWLEFLDTRRLSIWTYWGRV